MSQVGASAFAGKIRLHPTMRTYASITFVVGALLAFIGILLPIVSFDPGSGSPVERFGWFSGKYAEIGNGLGAITGIGSFMLVLIILAIILGALTVLIRSVPLTLWTGMFGIFAGTTLFILGTITTTIINGALGAMRQLGGSLYGAYAQYIHSGASTGMLLAAGLIMLIAAVPLPIHAVKAARAGA